MPAVVLVSQADLVNAIGLSAVLSCCDDDGDTTIDAAPMAALLARAETWVYSHVAHSYKGPFPIATQVDAPGIFAEAALYKAIHFLYLRKPDFIRQVGSETLGDYERMAKELLDRLSKGIQRAPDYVAEPDPQNVQVAFVADGTLGAPALNADGDRRFGDF